MSLPHTALLLGGSGYVGSALARVLTRRGDRVCIADLQPSAAMPHAFARCDVRDADAVTAAMRDMGTLYLLAAEHGLEPRPRLRFEETNVGGAHAVAAAARRTGLERIVLTSTVAVYGLPGTTVTEDSPCRPINDYGRTKLAAEEILRAWAAEDPARTLVVIRPTVVFGPGVRGSMRALFHQLAAPRFRFIGDGSNRKSFAQVENLAHFHAHAASLPPGTHLFNYADGPDLTMHELASVLRSALQLDPPGPSRGPMAAYVRAALEQWLVPFGAPAPEWTVARIRRFLADSRFVSSRVAATGFVAPLGLREALTSYARSDLRWTAGRVRVEHAFSPRPPSDVPVA